MSRSAEQKVKLLVLYDLLEKKTDEDHPMTTNEIVEELSKLGITATRQTLYDDIEVLNSFGYDIICEHGRNNHYYVADRTFERPEVQILLHAVGAAKFLTEKKASALSKKIAELLNPQQAEELRFGVPDCVGKSNNERILYSVDVITSALLNKKQVSFLYYDVDVNGKKLYRKDKERYVVNPLGLVYSGEYFYLVCFHDKYGDPANYRIDKMEDVREEKKPITKKKEYENFDLNMYRKESFSMFSGEKVEVTLFFPRDLIYVAKERFGDIIPVSVDNGYIIHTTVRVSKTFFAWLSTFEGQVKIIDPKLTQQQFKEFIRGILAKIE